MGGLDVSYGDSDHCPGPGRPGYRRNRFCQIELRNRSTEGCNGQAPIASGRAAGGVQFAAGFLAHGRHRRFCRSSGGTALVHHSGACAEC